MKKLFSLFIQVALTCAVTLVASMASAESLQNQTLSLENAQIAAVDSHWSSSLPRDPEQATELYMQRISKAATIRANSYFEGGYWLQIWDFLIGLGIAFLLLKSGLAARWRDVLERWTHRNWLRLTLYAGTYVLALEVLSLPMNIYEGYFREHTYGLSNQNFASWLQELVIADAILGVIGAIGIALLYSVVRRLKETWTLWGTAVAMSLLAFVMLVAPVFIDPLFNTYKPLENGEIRDSILSLARANGIPAKEVYQFDASKQSNRVSANVSGFLGTMSIRLNDNLLRRTSLPEIRAVMGHEMGHYVLNHIGKSLIAVSIIIFLGFLFLRQSFEFLRRRFPEWKIQGIGDMAGLPLAAALFSVYLFLMTPINNTITRTQEAEADLFGLNAAGEPDAEAEVDLKLTEYRKPDPSPLEEFIFFDHPGTRNRILMAMRYKAEHWPAQK